MTWFNIVTSKKPFLIQLQNLCNVFNKLVQNKDSFFIKQMWTGKMEKKENGGRDGIIK